jgi:hypothetical protein
MAAENGQVLKIEDGDTNLLHAAWSRSGKRLILSVAPGGRWDEAGQIELDHGQVEMLRAFLIETSST